ncbi:MAG: hypothetical protein ACTSW4_06675 [Candidatus Ranarchaeia archaeon]
MNVSYQHRIYQQKRKYFTRIKKKERVKLILAYLDKRGGWVTTHEINRQFPIAKRTLRATLASMVEQGLIRKTTSLRDTRVTLYSVKPVNESAYC